jgi:iron complex transport system permease protein
MRQRRWWALGALLVAAIVASVAIGTIGYSPAQVLRAVRGVGDPTAVFVVRFLRAPRALLAVLVGAGLGVSGGALQGTLRNPLAEPYLLGVSGGAAVGAVLATLAGLPAGVLPVAAFFGAIVAVVVTFFVAHVSGARGDSRTLLMAGVVVGAFANAAIMLALANAPPDTIRNAVWWMMGSVADASWSGVLVLLVYTVVAGALLVLFGREMDVLALGEDAAAGLGVNVDRALRRVFLIASLVAAATVAAAGLIGFVGLIVPHMARALGLKRARPLLLACALIGGILVVLADLAGRVVNPTSELPLGAITALVGVPFFLIKLRRLR